MNIHKISPKSSRDDDQDESNEEDELNESFDSSHRQTYACREEDEDTNNSTSRFDSDCIFQAMQDGLIGRRTEQEEFYNFSYQKDTRSAIQENENYQNYINILNQENMILHLRNDQLIHEIEISRSKMESDIEQLNQKTEQVLMKQKETYDRSLETLTQQHCLQIQAHQAVQQQLENTIIQLKNEVVAVKKDKETLEKLYEGKKNAQDYGKVLAKKTSLPDSLKYLQEKSNIEQPQNSENTICSKNYSFSQHLAEIREKQYEVLRENTQINNQNHNNNSTNKGMLKGSFGKLALLAHLGSESVDLSNKTCNVYPTQGITLKQQQQQLNQNAENIFQGESQVSLPQAGVSTAPLNWQDHTFKLRRLSQQISKEKINKCDNNSSSNPFSFEFEVPAPSNFAPYNSRNQLEADEQQLLSSKFSSVLQSKEDDLYDSNAVFSGLSTTFNNERFQHQQKEQQTNQLQRTNLNLDQKRENQSFRTTSTIDSSLSRVKHYENSLMLIQRACSLGPSRKNSCLEEDYHKFASLNSQKRMNNNIDSIEITNHKNKDKFNKNILLRRHSLAIPQNSIPCQSFSESKYLITSQSYMKQTQSSRQKQAQVKIANQFSPEKRYTKNQCKHILNNSNNLSKKAMFVNNQMLASFS